MRVGSRLHARRLLRRILAPDLGVAQEELLLRREAVLLPGHVIGKAVHQRFTAPAPACANLKTGRGPRNLLERRWWLWGLQGEISRIGIDLFHGTDFGVRR